MKDPHKASLINWLDGRGANRSEFTFDGSSKTDRSSVELIKYVRYCLWKQQSDLSIKQLLKQFDYEMDSWKNGKTEKKKVYASIY